MPTIDAHGIAVSPPAGWDGQIFRHDPEPIVPPAAPGARAQGLVEATPPVAHVANFALPPERGDFGGGAVELMASGAVFISLLEHPAEEAATALFAPHEGVPWPVSPDDFSPATLQRGLTGQSGLQRFFVVGGRPFCLYVVLGSHRLRSVLVPQVNEVLASIAIA
jgi:hypothetical protein